MNIIPRLSGPVQETGGVLQSVLPLVYTGDCPFAGQFPMALSFDTVAVFSAESYRLTATGSLSA